MNIKFILSVCVGCVRRGFEVRCDTAVKIFCNFVGGDCVNARNTYFAIVGYNHKTAGVYKIEIFFESDFLLIAHYRYALYIFIKRLENSVFYLIVADQRNFTVDNIKPVA